MRFFLVRTVRNAWVVALLATFWVAGQVQAVDVVEVEEHWALTVGGPEEVRSAPQVSMVMSPTSNLDGDFFVVTINHWSFPQFAHGGVQVQRWTNGDCVEATEDSSLESLHHDGEVVSWVQQLSVSDGELTFEVTNGSSESWGSFGDSGELRISKPTTLVRLNDYVPAISLKESGIGFAGNRVSSLILQKIRWKTSDGEEHEMVAPIDIDADLDP